MLIKRYINVQDDKLSDGLQEVFLIMNEVENSKDSEDTIDFSDTRFVSPTFLLPLMIYANGNKKAIRFSNITPFMQHLYFDEGLISDQMRNTEFIAKMEGYTRKTYTPIINFPAIDHRVDEKEWSNLSHYRKNCIGKEQL